MIRLLALLTVFTAAFVPHMEAIRPFHPAFALLTVAWFLTWYRSGFRGDYTLGLIALATMATTVGYLVNVSAGIEPGVGTLWSWLPLSILVASAMLFAKLDVSDRAIRNVCLLVAAGWCALIAVQIFAPLSSLSLAYVSPGRREQMAYLSHYLHMVMAPTGNPNNSAMLFALLVVALLQLRPGPAGWPLVGGLLVGVFLGYARTATGALLLALVWLCLSKSSWRRWTAIFSIFALPLAAAAVVHWWPEITLVARAVAAFEDNSLAVRTDRMWPNALAILQDQPFSILAGWGWFEEALFRKGGETGVDSSYLFVLVVHGAVVLAALLGAVCWFWFNQPSLRPQMIILALCAVTAAWISDYRLNILVGALLGAFHRPMREDVQEAVSSVVPTSGSSGREARQTAQPT